MNTNTCKSFAALSLGRVSRFGKDPVYAASEKVDRKSAEHLFWRFLRMLGKEHSTDEDDRQ